jgi:thiol-disulfide isomerase/thioredoxin
VSRFTGFTLAGLLLGACIQSVSAAESALLRKPAPQFVRQDLSGRAVNLRAYRGKVVLLSFWATWCAPCQQELPQFAAWQHEFGGLQVIAVSMDDDAAPVRALVHKLGLQFPIAMGDAALGKRYGGVLGLPVTFLIARDGTVAERFEGEVPLAQMEKRIEELLAQR